MLEQNFPPPSKRTKNVRNSYTPSPLRYALTKKKNRLEVELLCSCSLRSKVVQGK
jgi:hypothetical protein